MSANPSSIGSSVDAYTLADAARRAGVGALFDELRPLTGQTQFSGWALTARVAVQPHGSVPLHDYGLARLLDPVKPGHVVLLDVGGLPLTALGDIAMAVIQARGGVAAVVNGRVRDIETIEELGLPVFARDVGIATVAGRGCIVGVGEPVQIAGVRVETGDLIAGCRGGVIAVPAAHADRVLVESARIEASDRAVLKGLRRGEELSDLWRRHKNFSED